MCKKDAREDEPAHRSGDEAIVRTPPWSEREEARAGWPAACELTGTAVKTPTSPVSKIFYAPKWGRDYNYFSVPRSEEIIVVRTLPPPEVQRRPLWPTRNRGL